MTTVSGANAHQSSDADIGPEADLSGRNLVGIDLSGRDLTGADFTDADLSRANLSGACLNRATLVNTTLFEADLSGAQFIQADLTGADCRDVRAGGAVFGGATMDDASFFGADLTDSALAKSRARRADFRTAKLARARMNAIGLSEADLSKVDLHGADLSEAIVDKTSFRGADLQRTMMRGVSGYTTTDWIGVDIVDSNFAGAYLVRRAIMDQNYLEEFRTRSRLSSATYFLWKVTSDCGRSLTLWGSWIVFMALAFAGLYGLVDIDYGDYPSRLAPVYFSVVTLTTLGYGDGLPASQSAQLLVIAEVIAGYIMLGGLLSIFATKMGRRAE